MKSYAERPRGVWCIRTLPLALLVMALVLTDGCQTTSKIPGLNELGKLSGLQPSEEDLIARVLDDVQRGMESRRIYKVLAHVSRNYYDNEDRDYEALKGYLNAVFKNYREIRITRTAPRIIVDGNTAKAHESFGTIAEPRNSGVDPPVNLQGQVTVDLEKAGGRWMIVEWGTIH